MQRLVERLMPPVRRAAALAEAPTLSEALANTPKARTTPRRTQAKPSPVVRWTVIWPREYHSVAYAGP
jgi:hypothetical protein